MRYDRMTLGRKAKELGFVRDTFEKVCRLVAAIGSEETPTVFSLDSIDAITQNRIKTDLLPVLRNSAFFDVKAARTGCISYLEKLLILNETETEFLRSFRERQYRPELLFEDADILARISCHPMALWKCGDRDVEQEES